eukprot:scaffold584580_cov15-Prasinocladus_malaysianus.AAC.1
MASTQHECINTSAAEVLIERRFKFAIVAHECLGRIRCQWSGPSTKRRASQVGSTEIPCYHFCSMAWRAR